MPEIVEVIFGRPAFFRRGADERLRRFEGLIGVPLLVAKTRSLSW
jgi:hypothetical protein